MRVRSPRPSIPAQAVQLGWTLFFLVFILLVLNAAGWFYYRTFRANWETELNRSLTAVASTAAARVTATELRDLLDNGRFGFAYATLRHQWLRTRASTPWIQNIFLFDKDGQTLVDLEADPPLAQKHPALVLDPRAPEIAFLGRPTASALYKTRNAYYKTAYAPLAMDTTAAEALLAIEADASFFSGLERMRSSLLLVAAVSTLAVLLLGLVFVRATRGLMAAEERARRSETLASMGQLTATMAHEIRNPLAIIRATAERLKKAPPDDEIWQYIPEEVERLNGILSTYLDFARSDPERATELELRESLDRVRLLCEPNLVKTGIRVETDFPARPGEAVIQGSPAAIRQVFLNLILNAQEAMPSGGRLGLAIRREGRDWVCEVSDTGQGIPREDLRKIFDPFYSSKERGTGLGLAVVDRIVREHKGRVEVRSKPGEGSVFQIRFPARTS
jgi:signal transduction histidine kinase